MDDEGSSGENSRRIGRVGGNRKSARVRALGGQVRVIGLALMLPLIMVVGPVAGYYIGHWIGGRFGWGQWVAFAGLGLGVVAAVQQFVRTIRRLLRELG